MLQALIEAPPEVKDFLEKWSMYGDLFWDDKWGLSIRFNSLPPEMMGQLTDIEDAD